MLDRRHVSANHGTRDELLPSERRSLLSAPDVSNAVYQVPNYAAAQTYEDNKVPEGLLDGAERERAVTTREGATSRAGHVSLNDMVPVRYVRIKANDWMNFPVTPSRTTLETT